MAGRKERLQAALQHAFAPEHLEVINESDGHNVPRGSESHFRVVLVSAQFEGLSPVARHRLVYAAAHDELTAGVHALAVTARTPAEWAIASEVPKSPPCEGGHR